MRYLQNQDSQLVWYSRSDKDGPKLSDYYLSATKNPDDLAQVLEKALGIRGKVQISKYKCLTQSSANRNSFIYTLHIPHCCRKRTTIFSFFLIETMFSFI